MSSYSRWLLHYYREAEMRSADLLQRLLRQTEDPDLLVYLTRQLADEASHIQMWSELMSEMGESLVPPKRGYRQYLQKHAGLPDMVCNSLALICAVEEHVQQRYRDHLSQAASEPRIVALLEQLATDEEWRVQGVRQWLAKQEKREGQTRVNAALDYYRSAEAMAYAELIGAESARTSPARPVASSLSYSAIPVV
jgi:hypothetical protein